MKILFQTSNGLILYIKEGGAITSQYSKDEVIEIITNEMKKSLEQDELLTYNTLCKLLYCILKEYEQF